MTIIQNYDDDMIEIILSSFTTLNSNKNMMNDWS